MSSLLQSSGLTNYAIPNGKIVATVASNNLTVAIKTAAGNNPSRTDPLYMTAPETAGSGALFKGVPLVTSPSVTINTGGGLMSSFGAIANVAFRLWVLLVDPDGVSPSLALINCSGVSADGLLVYAMDETGSVRVFDSGGTTLTGLGIARGDANINPAKPYRIIGYLTWSSGLPTPGSYSLAPDVIQMMGPGIGRPGQPVQNNIELISTLAGGGTGSSLLNNTVPQDTIGGASIGFAVLPIQSPANLLEHEMLGHFAFSATGTAIAALFKDSDANALAAAIERISEINVMRQINLSHWHIANASSAEFNVNVANQSGTTFMNGTGAGQLLGGVLNTTYKITERMG